MELRPEFLVPAIAKTLKDVVLPALDDEHQVAQEQIKLAIGFLEIMALRQPLQYAFDCDELKRHQEFAAELCSLLSSQANHGELIANAGALLEQGLVGPSEITAMTSSLRTAISAMIDAGHGHNDPLLSKDLSARMRAFAKVQLCRERAWVEPMGFETGAEDLPSIEGQLKAH